MLFKKKKPSKRNIWSKGCHAYIFFIIFFAILMTICLLSSKDIPIMTESVKTVYNYIFFYLGYNNIINNKFILYSFIWSWQTAGDSCSKKYIWYRKVQKNFKREEIFFKILLNLSFNKGWKKYYILGAMYRKPWSSLWLPI